MTLQMQITWFTLLGLSLLFVGGFVLWVYGAENKSAPVTASVAHAETLPERRAEPGQWFFIYGIVAVIFGVGSLMAAATLIM